MHRISIHKPSSARLFGVPDAYCPPEPAEHAPAPLVAPQVPVFDRVRALVALRGILDRLKDPTVLTALQTLLMLVLALVLFALVLAVPGI